MSLFSFIKDFVEDVKTVGEGSKLAQEVEVNEKDGSKIVDMLSFDDVDYYTLIKKASKLKELGQDEDGIEICKYLAEQHCDASYPYDELCRYFRWKKLKHEERYYLQKAIETFENYVSINRTDRLPKLTRYREWLKKLD